MIFVDTNYFIRYLRDDIPEQSKIAKSLFLSAAGGKKEICTSLIVFFEIFWVVDRLYKYKKDEIIKVLRGVLAMDFLILPERELLKEALELFEGTLLELEDCYNIEYSKINKAESFLTFDRKLGNFLKKE